MEKLIFKDLMDALNMKIYNIDKFDIIECYTATRFTIGQIRLLLSSLSTTYFRYRALLALVEYMPTVREHEAVHIVTSISECESQCEIRIKALKLLVEYNKIQDNEVIGNVYKVITRDSLPENLSMILPLTSTNLSTEENSTNTMFAEIEPNSPTNAQLTAEQKRADFLRAHRKYIIYNKIHPLLIEDCASSVSLRSNMTSKCCFL